jgi:EmrB/QacA subfamily drug resistance transporter
MNTGPMPCTEASVRSRKQSIEDLSHDRWVLVATVLGSSMEFIDGTVVNVALPSLQAGFHATGSQVQWVVEAYALFIASLILVGGSLGDRFGLRRSFLAGVVIFSAASVWCGVAPSITQLLIARCLQGVGGALLVPNSLALLSVNFSEARRGRAIGTWSGFASMMTALGPIVGGWVVQHGSWRYVFFLNVPIAVATIWITLSKTPAVPMEFDKRKIDWAGALLGTCGLAGVTFSLMEWSTGGIGARIAGVVGIILLSMFVFVEKHAVAPTMPLDLFRNRSFAGANLLTFFLYGALSSALFYMPLNLIQVQGYSPTAAGAAMLPLVIVMFLLARWGGSLIERTGPRVPLVVGPLVASLGYALLGKTGLVGSYWTACFPAMAVLGLGMTISVAPLTTVVMSSVDQKRTGAASGVNNAVSQTAGLLALAITAPLFFHTFSISLNRDLVRDSVSSETIREVWPQRSRLAAIQTEDSRARTAIDDAFVSGFRLIAFIASASAIAAAASAAATIGKSKPKTGAPIPRQT